MLYYFGYIPPKEFKEFYADLVRDISERFTLNKLAQKNRIPHVTLKSPFEMGSPKILEDMVSRFCQSRRVSKIDINRIESFGEEVLHLGVLPSRETLDTFKSLLDSLRDIEGVSWNEYDNLDKRWHITLAKGEELNGRFQEVYDYLLRKDIEFVLPFDNITIFQKDGGRTSVYRTHYLGKRH